jgi:hypothetical protein
MPTAPGPHFIVRQPRLAFGPLQALLHPMPGLEHPRELRQRQIEHRIAQQVVVFPRPVALLLPEDHQHLHGIRHPAFATCLRQRPDALHHHRTFLPRTDLDRLPRRFGHGSTPVIDSHEGRPWPTAATGRLWVGRLEVAHLRVRRHRQQIPLPARTQFLAKPGATAHFIIATDPGMRQELSVFVEHLQGQLVPGPEAHRLGDAGLSAPLFVLGPFLGQVETDIDQGVLAAADVGEVDADLTVVDLAQPAAPLPLHADGGVALFGECRGVEDEDAVGAAQLLAYLSGQLGQPGVVVPGGLADELLEGFAFVIVEVGDRLDVLVLQAGEQSGDIGTGMLALFAALEQFDEGIEEAFQAGQDGATDTGIDFGIRQESLAAGSKAALHGWLLPRGSVLRKSFVGDDLAAVKEGSQ